MPDLTEFFLDGLDTYGTMILGVAMFMAAGGLPNPAVPLVIAAGAFVRMERLDPLETLIFAFVGIVGGDSFSYGVGRYAGDWVHRHLNPRREAFLRRADLLFSRFGPVSLLISHSLVTSLDVPANVTAGLSLYSYRRFILFVMAGRFAWLLFYGLLGYFLGSQWERASQLVSKYTFWLGLIFVVLLVGFYLRRRRTISMRKRQGRPASGT
jgi:membrane protein DedA with SNARE-associated domain